MMQQILEMIGWPGVAAVAAAGLLAWAYRDVWIGAIQMAKAAKTPIVAPAPDEEALVPMVDAARRIACVVDLAEWLADKGADAAATTLLEEIVPVIACTARDLSKGGGK